MKLLSPKAISSMRKGGEILHKILYETKEMVTPGVNVLEIEKYVDCLFRKYHVKPSFKGYQGFPSSICLSINDQVVHGIPTDRILNQGDIIGLDCGVEYEGYHTDSAITVMVGEVSKIDPAVKTLVEVTQRALLDSLPLIRPGVRIGDLSASIEHIIASAGFSVADDLGGHGIGRTVHEDPYIPNTGVKGTGQTFIEGMTVAIEPISIMGESGIFVDEADGWTIYSEDGTISAHFEHTVYVTKNGVEILT